MKKLNKYSYYINAGLVLASYVTGYRWIMLNLQFWMTREEQNGHALSADIWAELLNSSQDTAMLQSLFTLYILGMSSMWLYAVVQKYQENGKLLRLNSKLMLVMFWIPLLNFYLPFRIFRILLREHHPEKRIKPLLYSWLFFWIIFVVSGFTFIMFEATRLSQLLWLTQAEILICLSNFIFYIVTGTILRRIRIDYIEKSDPA